MPTIIGQELPPTDRTTRPRRMSLEDWAIWTAWRDQDTTPWQRLFYDVGVGDGRPIPEDVAPEWRDYWLRETQRRIDVVGITATKQVIIEVRARALANALGRLIIYRALYRQDPITTTPIETWLITDTHDPELANLFQAHDIHWIHQPTPTIQLT